MELLVLDLESIALTLSKLEITYWVSETHKDWTEVNFGWSLMSVECPNVIYYQQLHYAIQEPLATCGNLSLNELNLSEI